MNRQIQDDALYNDRWEKEEKKSERNISWIIFKVLFSLLGAELIVLLFLKFPVFFIIVAVVGGLAFILYKALGD